MHCMVKLKADSILEAASPQRSAHLVHERVIKHDALPLDPVACLIVHTNTDALGDVPAR